MESENEDENEEEEAVWAIPKLHAMSHYVQLVKTHGAAAHFSTDQSERMHIQAAKIPYRRSNRREFMTQIVNHLDMSERVREHDAFFRWRRIKEESLYDELDSADEFESDEEVVPTSSSSVFFADESYLAVQIGPGGISCINSGAPCSTIDN